MIETQQCKVDNTTVVKTQQTFWVYLDSESDLEDLELPAESGEPDSY